MINFSYENKCEIHFGRLDEIVIAKLVKKFEGKIVMLHYGMGSVIKSGLLGKIKSAMDKECIKYIEFGGVRANPYKSLALKGIEIARKNKVNFILAIGGGSVIDSAKCIAVGVLSNDVWSHYAGRNPVTASLPVGVVLTLPAAGSECSNASVIKDDQTGIKYSIISSELTRPKFAFINPEYCMTLPKNQIANGASDIFAHLFERYFVEMENEKLTDKLLAAAMQSVIELAPKVYADITNYDNLANFCLVGTMAHNSMLNMGRGGGDWTSHRIDTTLLSGVYDIAHGEGLAIIIPAYLKYLSEQYRPVVLKFAREVMQASGKNDKEIIENAIEKLEMFYKSLGLPVRLKDMKINVADVLRLIKTVFPAGTVLGNYGKLNDKDIEAVIKLASE